MKKKCLFAFIAFLNVGTIGYSTENMNSYNYGCQKYGKETVDTIQANGTVSLEGTKVLGLVNVNGSLYAEESAINSFKVNGQLVLKHCSISQTSSVNGTLSADNTVFLNEISVASQKVTLSLCTLNSLVIREIVGFNGIQVIDLRNGTKVNGPITVESGNGEVWLSSNSEVTGLVTGLKC